MKIEQMFLNQNEFSRPGDKLYSVKAIVIHWTANPKSNAVADRNFFENRKNGKTSYGSAHFIIGQDGRIIQCIPTSEVAYHAGSSKDPNGKLPNEAGFIGCYTQEAKDRFGLKANGACRNPNYQSIGIELCPLDWDGNFSEETMQSAVNLTASLLTEFDLDINAITTHHNLVGWKDCPRLWTKKPGELFKFKESIKTILRG